jgi:hypothetical protein
MSWTKTKKGFAPGPHASRADAIAAFWKFWPTIADAVAASIIASGMSQDHIEAMGEHVHAIDARLDWELGPGRSSKHHLCLSGKGDPVLRVIAEQWLRRAPSPDANWEYYASRQAHGRGSLTLEIAKTPGVPESGHKVQLDKLVCRVTEDDARELLDLDIHHPIFPSLDDDNLKTQIAFIGLDTLLGEDDVERWLGAIQHSDRPPEGAVPLSDVASRIEAFRARCTGDKWAVLKGTKDGTPIFVSKNTAIKRIDHLLLDMHVEIAITLRSPNPDGLTTNEEADALNAMEDALFGSLAKEAAYIGRETHAGSRTMHLHVMEGGPSAALIETWRSRNPAYVIEVSVRPDPRWDILSRWD